MARDFQVFDVVIPPGGSATAPQSFPLSLPARKVTGIEVIIPAGVRGVVHFALGSLTTAVIPSNAGGFIAGDNEKLAWDVSGQIDSGSWRLFAFNTGVFTHTLQVRFLLELIGDPGPQPAVPIPANQLNG